MSFIRNAKNGCNSEVKFFDIPVYNKCDQGYNLDILGEKLDKNLWITERLKDKSKLEDVSEMLIDWELYENGWLIISYTNKELFYYKCQIGNYGCYKPENLQYITKLCW